jgi:DNA-binding NarL/FixJ family response regulator
MKSYVSRRVVDNKDYSKAAKNLSSRQKLIIELFKDELTTDQMADKLRYSSSTIKQDIIKIYELFGVNSREQVVILAERAGLIK